MPVVVEKAEKMDTTEDAEPVDEGPIKSDEDVKPTTAATEEEEEPRMIVGYGKNELLVPGRKAVLTVRGIASDMSRELLYDVSQLFTSHSVIVLTLRELTSISRSWTVIATSVCRIRIYRRSR